MRRVLSALAILSAASPVSAAHRSPPQITLSQLRAHSGEALARRLFGDLAPDMFVRPDGGPATGPRPDRSAHVWAWSRPTVADRPGLCRSDAVIMNFEPDEASRFQDPPMRLRTISARTYYIVSDRRRFDAGGNRDPRVNEGCAELNPLLTGGIAAENTIQLARALSLFDELRAEAAAGRALAPLDCRRAGYDSAQPSGEAACLHVLAELDPRSVADVSHCSGEGEGPGGCIQLRLAEYFITFSLDRSQRPVRILFEQDPESIIVTAR